MKVLVRTWENVLVYRDGRLEKVLPAGRHRVWMRRREMVRQLAFRGREIEKCQLKI